MTIKNQQWIIDQLKEFVSRAEKNEIELLQVKPDYSNNFWYGDDKTGMMKYYDSGVTGLYFSYYDPENATANKDKK